MKTKFKIIAVVAMFLFSGSVFATSPKIKVVSETSFVLSVKNFKQSLYLNIKDKNDVILYSQVVESEKGEYAKKFSLQSWPDGVYDVDVEDNMKVITLSMEVKDNKIISVSNEQKTTFKPSLMTKGQKVFVSLHPSIDAPLDVTIYNEDDQLVYEGDVLKSGIVYDFKKIGKYTIALKNKDGYYSHDVIISE